jgi:putative MATE family efflux protein
MLEMKKSVLDTDRIGPLLFKLALPSFIGMCVMTLYNVVNTIFVGHSVGSLAIAALSIAFPFQMLSMGLGQMAGIGGASVISRLIGARDIQKAERTLGTALAFSLLLALIYTAAGLLFSDFLLKLAGASEAVLPLARDYMRIIFIGMISPTFAMSCVGLIVAEGNTRIPMIAQITGAVLNIILSAIFIVVLGWGVKGAAIGTVISQAVSALVFLVYYLSGRSYVKMRLLNLRIDLRILKDILAIGISAFAATMTNSISSILMMRMLEFYSGDLAISAYGILNRIMMFAAMPAMVTAQGMQPIAGFNYGSKRPDRVLKAIKISMLAGTCWGLFAFIILNLFASEFIGIFTSETELINIGAYALHRLFFFIYLIGILFTGMTTFIALGKAVQSFITSFARGALFFIPSLFIMGHFFQLDGVWLSFAVADLLTFFLVIGLMWPQITALRKQRRTESVGGDAENVMKLT